MWITSFIARIFLPNLATFWLSRSNAIINRLGIHIGSRDVAHLPVSKTLCPQPTEADFAIETRIAVPLQNKPLRNVNNIIDSTDFFFPNLAQVLIIEKQCDHQSTWHPYSVPGSDSLIRSKSLCPQPTEGKQISKYTAWLPLDCHSTVVAPNLVPRVIPLYPFRSNDKTMDASNVTLKPLFILTAVGWVPWSTSSNF